MIPSERAERIALFLFTVRWERPVWQYLHLGIGNLLMLIVSRGIKATVIRILVCAFDRLRNRGSQK